MGRGGGGGGWKKLDLILEFPGLTKQEGIWDWKGKKFLSFFSLETRDSD